MTSANQPPAGFETKSTPGYAPAAVPTGHGPSEPGYSNSPGVDPKATPKKAEPEPESGDTAPEGEQGTTTGTKATTKSTATRSGGTKS